MKYLKRFNESLVSNTIHVRVPVAITKSPKWSNCNFDSLEEFVDDLNKKGYNTDDFEDAFEDWCVDNKPKYPGDEPLPKDFDSEKEYKTEHETWVERMEEYLNFPLSFYKLINLYEKDRSGYDNNLNFLLETFKICGSVSDIATFEETDAIFEYIQDDYDYYKEIDGISSIKIIGNDFDDNDNFIFEVKLDREISPLFIHKVLSEIDEELMEGWGDDIIYKDKRKISKDDITIYVWWCEDYHIEEIFNNIKPYKLVVDEMVNYNYQKKFLTEHPEDYKQLEPFGYAKGITDEFDYLFSGDDMGLL